MRGKIPRRFHGGGTVLALLDWPSFSGTPKLQSFPPVVSEPGPRADTTGGKLCNFGVPEKDGQSRSASTVPPPWKRRGILPRMDQKQTGATTVSCARPEKSGNRTSLGLPHLQPTAVDPPNQAPRHPCGHLSNNNGQGELPENIPACKDHHSRIASPSFIQAFFTASFANVRVLTFCYIQKVSAIHSLASN